MIFASFYEIVKDKSSDAEENTCSFFLSFANLFSITLSAAARFKTFAMWSLVLSFLKIFIKSRKLIDKLPDSAAFWFGLRDENSFVANYSLGDKTHSNKRLNNFINFKNARSIIIPSHKKILRKVDLFLVLSEFILRLFIKFIHGKSAFVHPFLWIFVNKELSRIRARKAFIIDPNHAWVLFLSFQRIWRLILLNRVFPSFEQPWIIIPDSVSFSNFGELAVHPLDIRLIERGKLICVGILLFLLSEHFYWILKVISLSDELFVRKFRSILLLYLVSLLL